MGSIDTSTQVSEIALLTDQRTDSLLGLGTQNSTSFELHHDYILQGNKVMVKINMIVDL